MNRFLVLLVGALVVFELALPTQASARSWWTESKAEGRVQARYGGDRVYCTGLGHRIPARTPRFRHFYCELTYDDRAETEAGDLRVRGRYRFRWEWL